MSEERRGELAEGCAVDGPTPCLVMGLMAGGSLRDRLVRPADAPDDWRPLVWQQRLLAICWQAAGKLLAGYWQAAGRLQQPTGTWWQAATVTEP